VLRWGNKNGEAAVNVERCVMKKRILIIDDEPEFVNLVKMRLEANGFEVITAYNGQEGLKVAKRELPDLILLDIIMPQADGFRVYEELHGNPSTRDIPVIVVTARGKMKDLFDLEEISGFVEKPFEDAELLEKIKGALR
jgi:DNA-binding response OmpR family regulator